MLSSSPAVGLKRASVEQDPLPGYDPLIQGALPLCTENQLANGKWVGDEWVLAEQCVFQNFTTESARECLKFDTLFFAGDSVTRALFFQARDFLGLAVRPFSLPEAKYSCWVNPKNQTLNQYQLLDSPNCQYDLHSSYVESHKSPTGGGTTEVGHTSASMYLNFVWQTNWDSIDDVNQLRKWIRGETESYRKFLFVANFAAEGCHPNYDLNDPTCLPELSRQISRMQSTVESLMQDAYDNSTFIMRTNSHVNHTKKVSRVLQAINSNMTDFYSTKRISSSIKFPHAGQIVRLNTAKTNEHLEHMWDSIHPDKVQLQLWLRMMLHLHCHPDYESPANAESLGVPRSEAPA